MILAIAVKVAICKAKQIENFALFGFCLNGQAFCPINAGYRTGRYRKKPCTAAPSRKVLASLTEAMYKRRSCYEEMG